MMRRVRLWYGCLVAVFGLGFYLTASLNTTTCSILRLWASERAWAYYKEWAPSGPCADEGRNFLEYRKSVPFRSEESVFLAAWKSNRVAPLQQYRETCRICAYADQAADREKVLKALESLDLVRIPGGAFVPSRESDHGGPLREVPEFFILATEVLNAHWKPFMEAIHARAPDDPDYAPGYFERYTRHPLVGISYAQSVGYTSWLSRVLNCTVRRPTSDEFEWASLRGSFKSSYPWGEGEPRNHTRMRENVPAGVKTASTDEFPPYRGLWYLSGNVWEFLESPSFRLGESGKQSHIVLAGGGYNSRAGDLRVDSRRKKSVDFRDSETGFRIVVTCDPLATKPKLIQPLL